jgi:glycine dehydrogenase subunit 1
MVVHKFLPNSNPSITRRMLESMGLSNVDELFSDVPSHLQIRKPLKLPEAMSEIELERYLGEKLSKNKSAPEFLNFLGGGVWLHHVPSIVGEILSRGEFYTSYTPYQPEISQGMLQSLFEYQSQICELTGMEVANSSMYDWSTALGEAARMATRITHRKKIIVCGTASPDRVSVLRTYCYPASIEVINTEYDMKKGCTLPESLKEFLNEDTAAVYLENPNFFGVLEEHADELGAICHSSGAIFIVGVNPSSLGVLRPPGDYGADIVIGDGQPLGLYPNYGGPLIGIFATRRDPNFLRQMPGRLIGKTVAVKDPNRNGYVMVLQTREQHIRREQATSNICTNEALLALAVSIYLAALGPEGMKEVGKICAQNAHHAKKVLSDEGIVAPAFSGSFFSDLSVRTELDSIAVSRELVKHGILGGLPLSKFFPDLSKVSIFSFNEMHTENDIERLGRALKAVQRP